MQKNKNSLTPLRRVLLGTGRMSSIVQCSFLALFYSYTKALAMPVYFVIPAVLLAVAIPLVVMPLIYNFINGISSIATGKYHLVFPAVTLCLAASLTFLFGIGADWSFPAKAINLFFSMSATVLLYLVYASVFSSISTRICEKNEIGTVFSFIGAALIIVTLVFLGAGELYSQLGFLSGAVILITGFAVYLTSSSYMPVFIRLEVPKKRNVFVKYNKFFTSFSTKENRRAYLFFFLMCISVQITAIVVLSLKQFIAVDSLFITVCAVITLICAVCSAVLSKFMRKKNAVAMVAMTLFCVLPLAVLISLSLFNAGTQLSGVLLIVSSILYGVGAGLFYVISTQTFEEIYDRSSTTRGTLVNIKNMLFFASFVISFSSVCVAGLFNRYFVLIALSVSFLFLLAAFILRTAKKRYLTLDYPEGLDDLGFKN